jgi:hypothetical protein
MPLGIVLRQAPGVTRWARWSWSAVAVLPGAPEADWRELRREGEAVEYHAGTVTMELHGADTEAYVHELGSERPSVYVVMRPTDDDARPFGFVTVTASPYEAQDYTDSDVQQVERVAMPLSVLGFVQDFVATHHREETFVKRRRDKKRVDLTQDGVGDARISQATDVYRSPSTRREVTE